MKLKTLSGSRPFFLMLNVSRPVFIPTILCGLILLASCATSPKEPVSYSKTDLFPEETEWTYIEKGITFTEYKNVSMQVEWRIVKIDLEYPELELVLYPDENDFKGDSVPLRTIKKFSRKTDAITVINATPFSYAEPGKGTFAGMWKSGTVQFSPAVKKYCALAIDAASTGYKASIIPVQDNAECQVHDFIAGGFFLILWNDDSFNTEYRNIKDWRTAAAVSEDGRFLYLLNGKGLSYGDCSAIFRNEGLTLAMEFDGGKSTCMTIKEKSYQPLIRRPFVLAMLGFR